MQHSSKISSSSRSSSESRSSDVSAKNTLKSHESELHGYHHLSQRKLGCAK